MVPYVKRNSETPLAGRASDDRITARREANRERLRKLRAAKHGWNNEKNARWKLENPDKARCHKEVESAVRKGQLVPQPCERCGSDELIHAHHDDYNFPLAVMWLCPLHHRERHRELGPDGAVRGNANSGAMKSARLPNGIAQVGEANWRAKLTESQVREIRSSSENGPQLAARFGVAKGLIYQIRSGKIWRHLLDEDAGASKVICAGSDAQ